MHGNMCQDPTLISSHEQPMTTLTDPTHAPGLRSWVPRADIAGGDFPIQNLPFGRFHTRDDPLPRIGVAIGEQVLDLRAVDAVLRAASREQIAGAGEILVMLAPLAAGDLQAFMAMGTAARRTFRAWLSAALAEGSPLEPVLASALCAQFECTMHLPCQIGDYTDFYTGIHHATASGRISRPDSPLLPNYKWVPVGYHGRASSIVVSGTPVRRPTGQIRPTGSTVPVVGSSQRLDFELELGAFIGTGNALGDPVPIDRADDHLFGMVLLNDWSARDVQAWESQPLGPFLAKSFASTISPWIVTMEALAPFRQPFRRPTVDGGDPGTLAYLDSAINRAFGAFDVRLEAWLHTPGMQSAGLPPARISHSNWPDAAWWTLAQLVTHHTMGGCNLRPGDLLGTGTLSGPEPEHACCLQELTVGGKRPFTLPGGETRTFLENGDVLILQAYCERPGARRIGWGGCVGPVEG